jgi:hypothetical protein
MLLTMMLMLAITSALLELMIAAKIPAWRKLSHKSKLFNLVNSLLLSFLIGIAFGAAGLVAMGAGVISTLLSYPGYKFLYWMYDSPMALSHGGNMFEYTKNKWMTAFKDLAKVMYAVIKVITFPVWATRWIYIKINNARR